MRGKYSNMSDEQKKALEAYANFAARNKKHPSLLDLEKLKITRNKMRHHFGNLESMAQLAKKVFPDSFKDVIDEERFNAEVFNELETISKGYKKFFVTTAVAGCKVHQGFYEAAKLYCKKNKALLLILPSDNQLTDIHPSLVNDEHIVFDMLRLNSNIEISNIKIQAKMIRPLTGLSRFAQRRSFIFASPKQALLPVAVSNTKLPHVLMTTGAITLPKYQGGKYIQQRTDYIATEDHVIGGVIVEVKDENEYYFRHVQADNKGAFIDLGTKYSRDEVRKGIRAAAVVFGDFHSGETDPTALAGGRELCNLLRPKYLVLHDMFDGRSISHHEKDQKVKLARKAANGQNSLQAELLGVKEDTEKLYDLADQLVWVKSNHDEFLDRYLQDGRYMNEPHNNLFGLKLAAAMVEGKDPLRYGVETLMGLKNPEKIIWLNRDQDFKIAGCQCGAHGDRGSNGSKGTLASMEAAYGDSITGHAHFPAILRRAWQTGTKSYLKQDYNVGPSSWLHADVVLYENGTRQLIIFVEGRYHL